VLIDGLPLHINYPWLAFFSRLPRSCGDMQRLGIQQLSRRTLAGLARAAVCGVLCVGLGGCSVSKFAANRAGSALAGSGTVFAADDDPELIKAAAPFSLKLMESLLSASPDNRDLLLAACSGFTQYAYAFVEQDADELAATDFGQSRPIYVRARRMYLRARDYGLRGLAGGRAHFREELGKDPNAALRKMKVTDVPLLYWTAASWGKAIGLSKDNPELLADLSIVEALIDRALALDPDYDRGAIHGMLISYEMIRPRGVGEARERAKKHFDRAVELSGGSSASPYISLAEATCLPVQDRAGFESLLKKALEIDPDQHPEQRLMNLAMQKRARWLLGRVDELFLEPEPSARNEK
jgi:predicted anti-sigma-YlaC factor YlaD